MAQRETCFWVSGCGARQMREREVERQRGLQDTDGLDRAIVR